ncbi:putative mitochondrial protein [Trichinella spiralis]|uniref:Mitochondrial protein n=1 Tax=Trichinella spiralis TaxID=6334 RepID=A0ABR3KF61_TRISP
MSKMFQFLNFDCLKKPVSLILLLIDNNLMKFISQLHYFFFVEVQLHMQQYAHGRRHFCYHPILSSEMITLA